MQTSTSPETADVAGEGLMVTAIESEVPKQTLVEVELFSS
jgi:hypothetical protein